MSAMTEAELHTTSDDYSFLNNELEKGHDPKQQTGVYKFCRLNWNHYS